MFRLCLDYVLTMLTLCLDYDQTMFRLCVDYVQTMFRLCLEYVQTLFTLYLDYVQIMFRQFEGRRSGDEVAENWHAYSTHKYKPIYFLEFFIFVVCLVGISR